MNQKMKNHVAKWARRPCVTSLAPTCLAVAALMLSAPGVAAQDAKTPEDVAWIDLAFVTHLEMDMPEQDVFIEREPGSGEVYRVTRGDHDMSAPLFKTAEGIEHNPFNEEANGPHPKGEPMGMTLGEWLKHRGTGRYRCVDGEAILETEFTGLVSNGVYTMWYALMALPPPDPWTYAAILELPLGARDGSESEFRADAEGKASFVHHFKPCLQLTDLWTTALLAINWHSDGQTYKAYPGKFGYNAHVPLFVMLPPREGLE